MKRMLICIIAVLLALCGCSVNTLETDSSREGDAELPAEDITVYSFKAGKADAHLIYNSSFAVLIDCGEKGFGKEITGYMSDHGIKSLDLLIITHFDKDHVGGAAKVINDTDIKRVMVTNYIKNSKEYDSYAEALSTKGMTAETVRNRTELILGGTEITVCPPLRDSYPDSPSNNASLITTVRCGRCSLLFAADAENARLDEFMRTEGGHYDYVKIPYHGHFQQKIAPFLQMTSPLVAVITSSDREPEDPQVMKLLAADGAAVYLTRQAPVKAVCDGRTVAASYDE